MPVGIWIHPYTNPAPAEKKDKKDMGGSKADNEKNKNEKKDMGGK